MAYYWRLKDIPELRDVREPRGRRLWREAVARSTTPFRMLGSMALVFAFVLLASGAASILLPSVSSLWMAAPAAGMAALAVDLWIRQPGARRWLREHAHELDRYAPA